MPIDPSPQRFQEAPRSTASLRESLSTSHKKWIIVVLAMISFTHIMDFMVLMPLGPKLMDIFQITPQKFSFLVSIYSFTAGIFGFLGSLVFDRLDRKHALVGAYIGFLFGTLSCALAPTYGILLMARALSGAFGGLISGISFAIIGDIFSIHERGTATGKLMASFSLAATVGVPTGLLLSTKFGWHAPFTAIVIFGVIAISVAYKVIPNVNTHLKSHYSSIFSGVLENVGDENSRRALLTTFMMTLSQFVVIPFISPYLVNNVGFPEAHLPLVYLLGGTITIFSGPWVGKLCDRFTAQRVFIKTGLLFIIPVFFITHLHNTPIAIALTATTLFFLLSNSRMIPAMTIISSSIPPSRRGSFMSLNSCLQQMGAAVASFIGGFVVTLSMPGAEFQGFSHTAYIAATFGIFAYILGQRIKIVS
jgi:predicted MFS family arabinose efflux permease